MRLEAISLVLALACSVYASTGSFSSSTNGTYMVLARTKSSNRSISASSTRTSSTGHVGNYVAYGLGLSHTSAPSSPSKEITSGLTISSSDDGEVTSKTVHQNSQQAPGTSSSSFASSSPGRASLSSSTTTRGNLESSASNDSAASRSSPDVTQSQSSRIVSTSSLPGTFIASVHKLLQNQTTPAQITNSSHAAACLSTLYPIAEGMKSVRTKPVQPNAIR